MFLAPAGMLARHGTFPLAARRIAIPRTRVAAGDLRREIIGHGEKSLRPTKNAD